MNAPVDETLVRELLAALDGQLVVLRSRRADLAGLSEALVASDNDRMEGLLARMEEATREQAAQDRRLAALRQRLAEALGRPAARTRLSDVVECLPGPAGRQVERRRQEMLEEIEHLRRQHMGTALLLSECARVNRALLDGLFPEAQDLATYGAGGPRRGRRHTGLVDAEL